MVFFPILAEGEMEALEDTKGLKCCVNLLKSLNGSSLISKALPSGQVTSLLIRTIVAADSKALS